MKHFSREAEQIMMERFGKDTITHARSNKTYKSEYCCSNRRREVYSTWERRQPGSFTDAYYDTFWIRRFFCFSPEKMKCPKIKAIQK
ncbi:hypothetical protein AALB53_17860 [Lachnospiraceae bacterium 47-T17]